MHFRGCSGEQTVCTAFTIRAKPKTPVGFYLAATRVWSCANGCRRLFARRNMLACLLAKEGNDLPIDAAGLSLRRLCWRPVVTIWKRAFPHLSALLAEPVKSQCRAQAGAYPGTLPINLAQLKSVRRILNLTISSPPEFTATLTLSTISSV